MAEVEKVVIPEPPIVEKVGTLVDGELTEVDTTQTPSIAAVTEP